MGREADFNFINYSYNDTILVKAIEEGFAGSINKIIRFKLIC
jgi:hypothetical protein